MHELSPYQRGQRSEKNVEEALEQLLKEGHINGYRRTRKYSIDDRRGVDFYIFTDSGRVPLQVKSSHAAKRCHDHYSRRVTVPCIVGRGRNLVNTIKGIIADRTKGVDSGDSL